MALVKFISTCFIAVLICFIVSCEKEDNTTNGMTIVSCKIIEEGTGKAIPFAEIELTSIKNGTTAMSERIEKYYFADSSGNVNFEFKPELSRSYYIYANADGYFKTGNSILLKNVDRNYFEIPLDRKAVVKHLIINKEPKERISRLLINNFETSHYIEFNNLVSDTFAYSTLYANRSNKFKILIYRWNGDNDTIDQIIAPISQDTFIHNIFY